MIERRLRMRTLIERVPFRFALLLAVLLLSSGMSSGEAVSRNNSGIVNGQIAVDLIGKQDGYSATIYTNTNGLPTVSANTITETEDGFIWIGTYAGLIRYDGDTFVRMDSTHGITEVRCLFVDHKGRLWVGTNDNGVAVMERGEFRMWGRAEGLESPHIRAVSEDENGIIYVATTGGIAMIGDDMQLTNIDDPRVKDMNFLILRAGNDGLLYGMSNVGDLLTLKDGKIVSFLPVEENTIEHVSSVMPDPYHPGCLYIGTEDNVIYYGTLEDRLSSARAFDIASLSSVESMEAFGSQLWICAKNGIGVLDGDEFYRIDNLPVYNSVLKMIADYEGNLWFVSARQGVMKITRNQFTDIFERFELPQTVVNSTCKDRHGYLFLGTDEGLIVLDEENNWRITELPLTEAVTASGVELDETDLLQMLDDIRVRSVSMDSKGRLWIATWSSGRDYGLVRYDEGKVLVFTTKDGLYSEKIRLAYEFSDGRFMVPGSGGLNIIEGDRVTGGYTPEDGFTNPELLSVTEGFGGEIVVGSNYDGIHIIDGNGIRTISYPEGLESDSVMRVKRDPKRDVIWVITGNSLAWLDRDYHLTTLKKFPYPDNFDLYVNSNDEVWVLSSDGIYIVAAEDLLGNEDIDPVHYTVHNGLPTIATSNSYSELTEDGDLYIAGALGVAKVNIDRSFEHVSGLKVAVPFIDADGTRLYPDKNGSFTIGSDVRKLTIYSYVFNYSMLNPQVTYHLEGFDSGSVTVSRNELVPVDYTNLAGGEYDFVIRLTDPVAGENKTETFHIVKLRAFYENTWFYVVAAILGILIIAAVINLYLRRKIRKLEARHREEAEKQRINTELTMASQIQEEMLPHEFPPYPDRREFDIYASMDPAREVGGDFYDFFLIDDDHLCLVIADVSGKGVPASLFMTVTKVTIKNFAMFGGAASEIIRATNDLLCSNNQSEMFVTVWLGILEISTGRVTAVNAGHEYPALKNGGSFVLFQDKHGFVVGGMENMEYKEYEFTLKPGDKIFVYTDGVPESTNAKKEMFGNDRMIRVLNEKPEASPKEILDNVSKAVDAFVSGAEQFDDMTMLCLEYKGKTGEPADVK